MNFARLITREKLVDQLTGLAFGVAVAVGLAVGIEVYSNVQGASDEALLSQTFWVNVGAGAIVTGVRSAITALGTILGLNIRGVSSA